MWRDEIRRVLSEPSNPWIAGVSSLFTREFYQAVRSRLSPGGILAQWLQAYALSPGDYALVVRTVLSVFPHGALLRTTAGYTTLLASEEPLEPPVETLDREQALMEGLPPVKADLEAQFGS